MEENRREFLKKSALTGAVMWAAPVVTTLPKAGAAGTTPAPCPCTNCTSTATALKLSVVGGSVVVAVPTPLTSSTTSQCVCPVSVTAGPVLGVSATANVACEKVEPAACAASSYLADVTIRLTSVTSLKATLLSSCVACGTGASKVVGLKLVVAGVPTTVNVTGNCNQPLIGLNVAGLSNLKIAPNEQVCSNGTLTVRALRVLVKLLTLQTVEVIVGESKVSNCPCTACAATSKCTAPTGTLC